MSLTSTLAAALPVPAALRRGLPGHGPALEPAGAALVPTTRVAVLLPDPPAPPLVAAEDLHELDALVRAFTGRPLVLGSACDLAAALGEAAAGGGSAVVLVPGEGEVGPPLPDWPGAVVARLGDVLAPGGSGDDGADRLLALLLRSVAGERGSVLAVCGARGALGASVLVLLLARRLAELGHRVGVLDADPAGSLGLLAGDGVSSGLHWADLPDDERAFQPDRLVGALPTWRGIPIVTGDGRGGAPADASTGPVLEALRADRDLVIVDLPRGAALPPEAWLLMVSGLDLRSAAAAEALVRRAGTGPSALSPERLLLAARTVGEDLQLDELEALVGARLLGVVPDDRRLAERIARGEDPTRTRGALRGAAALLAEELVPLLPRLAPRAGAALAGDDGAASAGGVAGARAACAEDDALASAALREAVAA